MFMSPTALILPAALPGRHHFALAIAAVALTPMLAVAAPACAGPREPVAAAAPADGTAAQRDRRDRDRDDRRGDERGVDGRFEKTLNVKGTVDLSVSTGSGSVEVQPGGEGSIRVIGTIRASNSWKRLAGVGDDVMARIRQIEQNPPIEQTGNQVRIGDTHDDRLMENISISYQITVPSGTSLRSNTGSGSQEIGSLAGPVHASSGSGTLRIGATGGTVRAGTGSGSISVEGAKERVEANTGSGSITLKQIAGSAKAGSGSGSISLEQTAKGDVQLNTASGEIRVTGANGAVTAGTASGSIHISGKPDAPWSISSSSGSISLDLPTGAPFTLDARTTSGGIDIDHPVSVSSIHGRRREIHGAVNGGGPTVSVETTSGSIRIGAR
jgi:hypothetical protein